MANRASDWLRQALAELKIAEDLAGLGHHAWACFAAQQAGEKAVKAALERWNALVIGHNVGDLVRALSKHVAIPPAVLDACTRLNRHYVPTRYPVGTSSGAPVDQYGASDSSQALTDAREVIGLVRSVV